MLDTIKQYFKVNYKYILWLALIELIAFVLGLIILIFVMKFDTGDDVTSFECGTMLAFLVLLFTTILSGTVSLGINFNHAISMGKTRKSFVTGYLIYTFIEYLAGALLIYLFHLIEYNICTRVYSNIPLEVDFSNIITIKYMLLVVVIGISIQLFLGTMFLKFGKKAFWAVWVTWMAACLLPGKLIEAVEVGDNSIMGQIGTGIVKLSQTFTANQWVCIGCVGAVVFVIISYMLLRKQKVNFAM